LIARWQIVLEMRLGDDTVSPHQNSFLSTPQWALQVPLEIFNRQSFKEP
jgi:hypothetical protein